MLLNRRMKAVLSALLVSTTVLAACSSDKDNGASPAASGSPAAQEPAQIVELKALTMGTEPASGMANFYKQLDELTKKDLGATVRFTFIPWGDEKNQISRAIVAKEYDIYVGGAWSDFKNFSAKNAFADLKPLLSQTPKLVEHYKGVFDRVSINGKLYGIPQYGKPGAGSYGFFYREDLRKQWGLPEIKDLDTVEKYLYKAKQEFPDTPMINDKSVLDNVFRMIAGSKYYEVNNLFTVAAVSDPYKVMPIYETPEFKQAVAVVKKWYDDGIIARDVLSGQSNETSKTLEFMKANKKPLEYSNHFGAISSGYITQLKAVNKDWEFGWLDYIFDVNPSTQFMPKHSVDKTSMISVGAHSKYVETALKFIEKAHTDRTYYDLLQYGVKDENYKLNGESVTYDGIDPKNKKPGWTALNDGYMNREEKYSDDWQKIYDKLQIEGSKLAEKNGLDPYENLVIDTSDIVGEMANIETIKTQYWTPLAVGMVKKSQEADLETLKEQLKGAGFDKYMAALQKGLDDLKNSQKK